MRNSAELDIFDRLSPDPVLKSFVKPPPENVTKEDVMDIVRAMMVNTPALMAVAPPAPKPVEKIAEPKVIPKDQTKYAEQATIDELKQKIADLEARLESAAASSVVIGRMRTGKLIPSLSGQGGKVLTNNGSQLYWAQGGSAGTSTHAYTPTNVTTDRSFDADDTSLDEIADVLGSLIVSLQGAGIIL